MGDLEDVQEAFVSRLCGVEGEAVSEGGENEGVKEFAPVGIIESTNGVPENAEGADSGSCTVGHDGHVMRPVETFVDEDAEVANE